MVTSGFGMSLAGRSESIDDKLVSADVSAGQQKAVCVLRFSKLIADTFGIAD